jgi:hypothetical protein
LFQPEVDALGSGFDGGGRHGGGCFVFLWCRLLGRDGDLSGTLVVIVTFGNSPWFQDKFHVICLVKEHIRNKLFLPFIPPFHLKQFSVL